MLAQHSRPSYQLNSSESSHAQGVDDVEVHQLQVGEEGVLGLVSAFFKVEKGELLRGLNRVCDGECERSGNGGRQTVDSSPCSPLPHWKRKKVAHSAFLLDKR